MAAALHGNKRRMGHGPMPLPGLPVTAAAAAAAAAAGGAAGGGGGGAAQRSRSMQACTCRLASSALGVTALLVITFLATSATTSVWRRASVSYHEGGSGGARLSLLSPRWLTCLSRAIEHHWAHMCGPEPEGTRLSVSVWKLLAGLYLHRTWLNPHFIVGHEFWTWNTLQQLADDAGCHAHVPGVELIPLPKQDSGLYRNVTYPRIYAGYSRNKMGLRRMQEQRLRYLGFTGQVRWVSFGEVEDAERRRDWLKRYVWTGANSSTQPTQKYMLSTYNAYQVMDELCQSDDDMGLYVEDDAAPTYNFHTWFKVFINQLQTANPQWDLAFLGDCCRLSEDAPFHMRSRESYSPYVPGSRCMNGVLFKRTTACRILQHGPVASWPMPIDHAVNEYIERLQLNSHWSLPPLFEEASKSDMHMLCSANDTEYKDSLFNRPSAC